MESSAVFHVPLESIEDSVRRERDKPCKYKAYYEVEANLVTCLACKTRPAGRNSRQYTVIPLHGHDEAKVMHRPQKAARRSAIRKSVEKVIGHLKTQHSDIVRDIICPPCAETTPPSAETAGGCASLLERSEGGFTEYCQSQYVIDSDRQQHRHPPAPEDCDSEGESPVPQPHQNVSSAPATKRKMDEEQYKQHSSLPQKKPDLGESNRSTTIGVWDLFQEVKATARQAGGAEQQILSLESQLEKEVEARREAERNLDARNREAAGVESQLKAALSESQRLRTEDPGMRAEAVGMKKRLPALERRVAEEVESRWEAERKLDARNREVLRVETELKAALSDLHELQAEGSRLRAEREDLNNRLTATERRVAEEVEARREAERNLDARNVEVSRLESLLECKSKEVTAGLFDLEMLGAENGSLRTKVGELEEIVHDMSRHADMQRRAEEEARVDEEKRKREAVALTRERAVAVARLAEEMQRRAQEGARADEEKRERETLEVALTKEMEVLQARLTEEMQRRAQEGARADEEKRERETLEVALTKEREVLQARLTEEMQRRVQEGARADEEKRKRETLDVELAKERENASLLMKLIMEGAAEQNPDIVDSCERTFEEAKRRREMREAEKRRADEREEAGKRQAKAEEQKKARQEAERKAESQKLRQEADRKAKARQEAERKAAQKKQQEEARQKERERAQQKERERAQRKERERAQHKGREQTAREANRSCGKEGKAVETKTWMQLLRDGMEAKGWGQEDLARLSHSDYKPLLIRLRKILHPDKRPGATDEAKAEQCQRFNAWMSLNCKDMAMYSSLGRKLYACIAGCRNGGHVPKCLFAPNTGPAEFVPDDSASDESAWEMG